MLPSEREVVGWFDDEFNADFQEQAFLALHGCYTASHAAIDGQNLETPYKRWLNPYCLYAHAGTVVGQVARRFGLAVQTLHVKNGPTPYTLIESGRFKLTVSAVTEPGH